MKTLPAIYRKAAEKVANDGLMPGEAIGPDGAWFLWLSFLDGGIWQTWGEVVLGLLLLAEILETA